MHFTHLPQLAFLATSYLALDVLADSAYASSCNSISIYDGLASGWVISGNCAETSGIYNVDTSICINSCFANANGVLVARLK